MNILKIIGFILLVVFLIAIGPFIFMVAWNFVFEYFKHPELKINYWIAAAIVFLLSYLRSSVSVKK